jgi:hypothetical protein
LVNRCYVPCFKPWLILITSIFLLLTFSFITYLYFRKDAWHITESIFAKAGLLAQNFF